PVTGYLAVPLAVRSIAVRLSGVPFDLRVAWRGDRRALAEPVGGQQSITCLGFDAVGDVDYLASGGHFVPAGPHLGHRRYGYLRRCPVSSRAGMAVDRRPVRGDWDDHHGVVIARAWGPVLNGLEADGSGHDDH